MLKMTFVNNSSPSDLEMEINRFVNNNIIKIIDATLDFIRDGFDISFYFPRNFYRNNKNVCDEYIYSLREIIDSAIIYDELTPGFGWGRN